MAKWFHSLFVNIEQAIMKQNLVPIVLGSLLVLALAGAALLLINPFGHRPALPPGAALEPITLDEMIKLAEQGDKGAPEIPRLLACFEKDDEDLRAQAALTLAAVGGKSLDPVRAKLSDKNADVRFWAVQALAFMGSAAAPAQDDLVVLVKKDSDTRVRYKAVYALGRLGVKSDKVFVVISNALADPEPDVRDTAVEVLETLDAPPPAAAPALAKLAGKGADRTMRLRVLPILAKTGAAATPAFRELLQDANAHPAPPNDYTAQHDFLALISATGMLGPHVKTLLPELTPLLANSMKPDVALDQAMVEVFKNCGPEGAKSMAEALASAEKELIIHNNRLLLLQGLGEMGPEAKAAVPILIDLLKHQTQSKSPVDYRPAILEALGEIGFAARASIPVVEELTKDPVVGEQARTALRRMGVIEKK